MSEAVLFPDVEAALVERFSALLGVPASTRVPNPRPDSFVRVSRVGGARRDLVTDQPLVVVECWASKEGLASDLGRRALAFVYTLEGADVAGGSIRRVREVGGLQSFPDPISESPRYQFTVQIDTRGVPLR